MRFNGPQIASAIKNNNISLKVHTSSRLSQWKNLNKNEYQFIPMPFSILQRLTNIKRTIKTKEFDTILFDKLSSMRLHKDTNIIHGLATFSLFSGQLIKKRGGKYVLDRACPHIEVQNRLIQAEADNLGLNVPVSTDSFLERTLEEYELADKIILPSTYSYNSFLKMGVSKDKLVRIPLTANFKPGSNLKVNRHRNKNEKFVIGFIGGNVVRKGVVYLIEAWKKLRLNEAILRLKINQSELQKVPGLWKKIEDDPSIEVIGYVRNIESFYRSCDVFCLPSLDDGFGMVALEALACEVPVIISSNAGASELFKDQSCGTIVRPRNSDDIASAITKYYSDQLKLQETKKFAGDYFKSYSSIDYHTKGIADLYKNKLFH